MNFQTFCMLVRYYISRKYPKCVNLVKFNITDIDAKFAITFGDEVSYVRVDSCQRTIKDVECESMLGTTICRKLYLFNKYVTKIYRSRNIDRNLDVDLPRDRYPLILSCFDVENCFGYWIFRHITINFYKIPQGRIFYDTLDLLEAALEKEREEVLNMLRPLPMPISSEIEKYFL